MAEPAPIGPNPDTVGVIVPVHGETPFLAQTLEAVLTQDPPPADVVVVDDGSREPVVLPGRALTRCRLVRRETCGGPAGARQTGLGSLTTSLVALCDSDDAWEQGKLAAQQRALDAHPEAALCFGRATVVGADGTETGERWKEPRAGVHGPGELLPELYERNLIPTSSVVVRRRALEEVGGFLSETPHMAEDWDLWLRLLTSGASFVCEPAARVRYRRHPASLTADLVNLARGSLEVHDRHGSLVEPERRAQMRAADLTTLARGLIRRRDYAGARAALAEAASVAPPARRERALAVALSVPVVRSALGRRGPYPAARS